MFNLLISIKYLNQNHGIIQVPRRVCLFRFYKFHLFFGVFECSYWKEIPISDDIQKLK